ncbi:hypothetical protein [Agromyces albus]|uniref:Uncharacterized protein n=1 Tax=Agromyces albus TaxID=205332 RepID=A0A4Q2KU00_9MICO|nr:hypothetical protein [Agromyces albus]RXZ67193.1 hypothetical protein ESP51_18905 [Agromyces albus]
MRESHGGRRLATGITIGAGLIILAHLALAFSFAPYYLKGWPGPWAAWIALAMVVAVGAVSRAFWRNLPDWLYAALLAGLIAPLWLDVVATAGLLQYGVTSTAGAAAGAVLMPVAAIRGTRIPLAAAAGIGLVLAVSALVQLDSAGASVVSGLSVAASAVFPVVLVTLAVSGFRRLVGRELDLSLVQSTVGTPHSAVGMRASEELAQLDFDAEALLDDVGAGRVAIPVPAEIAERAGSLAARLRVRLIEGRTDTWLRHAVTESAYLSDRVTVDDPSGVAGLLSKTQRDGLLLALWLLVGERPKGATSPFAVLVACRESAIGSEAGAPLLTIAIDVKGVARRRVDPATWDALGSLGRYEVIVGAEGFRIDIACSVEKIDIAGSPAARAAVRSRGELNG